MAELPQHRFDDGLIHGVVLGHEDRQALEPPYLHRDVVTLPTSATGSSRLNVNDEPLPGTLVTRDLATHERHELLRDHQAESGAAATMLA